ncbi:unnamed protein product, partial [marine sediment metagenome]
GEPPRIAHARVGKQVAIIAGLAEGKGVRTDERGLPPLEEPSPFEVNQLAIILIVALMVSILVNIILAVM